MTKSQEVLQKLEELTKEASKLGLPTQELETAYSKIFNSTLVVPNFLVVKNNNSTMLMESSRLFEYPGIIWSPSMTKEIEALTFGQMYDKIPNLLIIRVFDAT